MFIYVALVQVLKMSSRHCTASCQSPSMVQYIYVPHQSCKAKKYRHQFKKKIQDLGNTTAYDKAMFMNDREK